jgi:hypothetical protein
MTPTALHPSLILPTFPHRHRQIVSTLKSTRISSRYPLRSTKLKFSLRAASDASQQKPTPANLSEGQSDTSQDHKAQGGQLISYVAFNAADFL